MGDAEKGSELLLNMALDLTLRATAERLLAERLLAHLAAERGLTLARDDDAERAVEKAKEEAVIKTAEKTAAEKKKAAERKEAEKKKAEKAEKERAEREKAEKKKAQSCPEGIQNYSGFCCIEGFCHIVRSFP